VAPFSLFWDGWLKELVGGPDRGRPDPPCRVLDGVAQSELFASGVRVSFPGGSTSPPATSWDGTPDLAISPTRVRAASGVHGKGFSQIADSRIDDPNFPGGARRRLVDVTADGPAT